MRRLSLLDQVLGIFIPLIGTNCLVPGGADQCPAVQQLRRIAVLRLGAAGGFARCCMFSASRERLEAADILLPSAAPPRIDTIGIMSLAFWVSSAWRP